MSDLSGRLPAFLYRPIVFMEPDRVVHPPSWLEHVPFAFWIVDVLRPRVLVELGTQSGNSYAAFVQAVQRLGLSTAAYAVDTWQGDSQAGFYDESVYEEWARYHDSRFSSFSRLVRSTFEEALAHFADGNIDLLHIDGCHTYEAVSADFAQWRPKMSARGVVLLHDVNVREGDFGAWRFWQEVQAQYPSFEFLHGHGLGVLGVGSELPESLSRLFAAGRAAGDSHGPRQFFARLGAAVSARLALQQLEAARQQLEAHTGAELAHRDQVVTALTGETGQLRAELSAVTAEREHLRQELDRRAAVEHQLAAAHETWRKTAEERTHLVDELIQLLARERAAPTKAPRNYAAAHREEVGATEPGVREGPRARRPGPALAMLAHPAKLRDASVVRASRLFDRGYYLSRYPDVAGSGVAPLVHFVLHGAAERRSPHALFDTAYYLRRNPDVAAAGVNPLVHYRRRGAVERRNPHPLFDVGFYLDTNPDVAAAGVEPLAHFLKSGAAEGRNPNPFFDCAYYLAQHPELEASRANPLLHFATEGWRTGSRPSESFDPGYYTARYEDIRDADENPLAHFLEYGRAEGRTPRGDLIEAEDRRLTTVLNAPATRLAVRSLSAQDPRGRTVLCVSPFVPLPDLGGSESRVYRLLRWLQEQGFRVVPVIAPLPHRHTDDTAVARVAAEFRNAVFCGRDGRVDYVLDDVPDVLGSLGGEFARPAALLLKEDPASADGSFDPTGVDRTVCHDALITVLLRLHPVLGRAIVLAESIWMCRVLPLLSPDAVKVVDAIGPVAGREHLSPPADLSGTPHEHRVRLQHADLVLTLDDEERDALHRLLPGKAAITAGVDCDLVTDAHPGEGRQIVCAMPDTAENRSGLSEFLRFVWPRIRRDVPDAELVVIGGVGEGLAGVPGVVWPNPEGDLSPTYWAARVAVSPSPTGAGPRLEVLDALAHLCPVLTWRGGRRGVPPVLSRFCIDVQDWFDFAAKLSALLLQHPSGSGVPADAADIARLASPGAIYQPLLDAVERLSKESARTGSEFGVRS